MTSACKTCPLSGMECREDCGFNTGKGCAVALLPRALENVAYDVKSALEEAASAVSDLADR